jgi:hypothetical protein
LFISASVGRAIGWIVNPFTARTTLTFKRLNWTRIAKTWPTALRISALLPNVVFAT